jgi:hypothetical protein
VISAVTNDSGGATFTIRLPINRSTGSSNS